MCLSPKWIYKKGSYKETNYRGNKGDFYEIGTYSKCGSCEVCINEKMNNWVIRNYYESKCHERKCFVTLTYAESSYILVRKDIQDWLKRFRIALDRTTGEKIRIFEAGEYGTIRGRPHFHVIIYGWNDEKPRYLGINKKKQILYQSKLIQDTWGLGRTSYQEFNEHEIPYIALYETPQETFKRAYKLNHERVKKLERMALNNVNMPKNQRNNLMQELSQANKELDENKAKYKLIREFNSWSQGLGWEKFYEEYSKAPIYTWTEYIEGKEFCTPTPWVKRLANMGDVEAAKEMFRREKMIRQSANEEEEKIKNLMKVQQKRKKEVLEWHEKIEIEEF